MLPKLQKYYLVLLQSRSISYFEYWDFLLVIFLNKNSFSFAIYACSLLFTLLYPDNRRGLSYAYPFPFIICIIFSNNNRLSFSIWVYRSSKIRIFFKSGILSYVGTIEIWGPTYCKRLNPSSISFSYLTLIWGFGLCINYNCNNIWVL